MDDRTEATALRALLDQVDARAPTLLATLAGRPRAGTLFGLFQRYELSDLDVAVVLVALAERLAGRPGLSGEELLGRLPLATADRLAAVGRLAGNAPLVATGFLLPDVVPVTAAEVLGTHYRLGEHPFRQASEVFGSTVPAPRQRPTGPYRSNNEVLADLRRLSLHYRRRAGRVFQLDPWSGAGLESADGAAALLQRARDAAAHVTMRLRQTEPDEHLPAIRLKHDHGLDLDSLVLLTTILFQELLEGVGAVDAVDLLKLVSENESDLIRRRLLLRPLQRAGLIHLEGHFPGKDLTADVSLPNRVVDELLGEAPAFDADSRLDFHAFLEQLDGSDPFFFDVDDELE